jgi:hypothetical protein
MLMLHFLQIALRISIHIYATILVTYDYKQGAQDTINVNFTLPTETDGIWLQFMYPSNSVHVVRTSYSFIDIFRLIFFNTYMIVKKETTIPTAKRNNQITE